MLNRAEKAVAKIPSINDRYPRLFGHDGFDVLVPKLPYIQQITIISVH
jgi:hypothetical protein